MASHFLSDTDMSLIVVKGIRGGICHRIYQYIKANNKYMKYYEKNKESSNIRYWDVNKLYDREMPQNLPAINFDWLKDTSQFNQYSMKNCKEQSNEGYFLEVDVEYLEKLHELHND